MDPARSGTFQHCTATLQEFPIDPICDGRSCAGATAERLFGRYQRTHSIHIGGDTGVRRQTDIIVCCPERR